jgi:DMSO/TMAO reductase YedYZ heme-binding membrane subunit
MAAACEGGHEPPNCAIGWNPHKRAYDLVALTLAGTLMLVIAGGTAWRLPSVTVETLILRATGVTALLLLHVILSIGPLCDWTVDCRLLPLLYNRRHLGVLMFLLAATHGVLATVQFHAGGELHPVVSLLTSSTGWGTVANFPFHIPGAVALTILFVMAVTSHDFWLRTLTAPVWKALHMGVYVAYGLVVAHVLLGALQDERSPAASALLLAGLLLVLGLHLAAARREWRLDATIG